MDKKEQGKKNRRSGVAFELKVRKDLENKGWIVAKWTNNVEFIYNDLVRGNKIIGDGSEDGVIGDNLFKEGKLIPAKRKYNPFMKALSIGVGFPDFIVFKHTGFDHKGDVYEVIGVEAKSNGYLDKEEKEKCNWMLDNHIFSKILIAKKGEKKIIYTEFEKKDL